MNIAIVGTGYVGLVAGICLSDTGNVVHMIDIDEVKINQLKKGKITIYEPGLMEIFQRNLQMNRLHFSTDLKEAIEKCNIVFFALPTPEGKNGEADLSAILSVTEQVSTYFDSYRIFVNKSTVPVGTAIKMTQLISERTKIPFDVVSNPEFLREGVAVEDFTKPDRIIIGTDSEKAREWMKKIYDPFLRQGNPIYFMDTTSAEMVKYAANAYLATRITFMNEIANICEKVQADVDWVRLGMGSDKRIGKRFLFPGLGYGGSCFPKDTQALFSIAKNHNYDFKILEAVLQKNIEQRDVFFKKILSYFHDNIEGKKMAVWGLAFKANTDDIRQSPALDIIKKLVERKASVFVFDPEAMENFHSTPLAKQVTLGKNPEEILQSAHALLILTDWGMFKVLNFKKMQQLMTTKVIFDGRNMYKPAEIVAMGFDYFSMGRLN